MSTDSEIFDYATKGDQVETTPETPVEAPTEAKPERARDEKGKFVKADPEPSPQEASVEPAQAEQLEAEPEAKDEGRIPSWRLKEEAERRREAEQHLNDLRNEMRQMQMQMLAQQRPPEPQAPQEAPDIFADPQGFIQSLQSNFDSRLKTLQLENSLRFAHYAHGEKFNEAYNALDDYVRKTGDKGVVARITGAPEPGEALVQWYKDQELHQQLGGSDLNSFLEKQREEWLKDPAVQAKVIEAFKATQQSQPSNTITQLPPSLSRASAAKSSHDDSGSSPQDIWNYATKR